MRMDEDGRDDNTPDQIWFLEHPPVYTGRQLYGNSSIGWNSLVKNQTGAARLPIMGRVS